MKTLKKFGDKLSNFTCYIACVLLFAIMILVIANILVRTFSSGSILGTTELVRYGMCIAAALALTQNEWVDGNVRVTILLEVMPKAAHRVVDFLCYVVTSIGFVPITYLLFQQAFDQIALNTLTQDLFMPQWIFSLLLAVGFLLLTICFWLRTIIKAYIIKNPESATDLVARADMTME